MEADPMGAQIFRHSEDPFRFIAISHFGIDIDAVAASGNAPRIAEVQRLLDGLAEVYRMGFENGERLAIIVDFPVPDLVAELRTDFLLAIHRGDANLRAHVLAEISRRAGTGNDPLVAFAPPLAKEDG
jgi:hypothetical protein